MAILSVIVFTTGIVAVLTFKTEHDPVLIVHANTEQPSAVAFQSLESITGRDA
jgi:hypothetical protein